MSLALHHLMADSVDYAGLFPPASLPLHRVIENFADYLQSADRWMLGRLIVPLQRLDELSSRAEPYLADTRDPWRVSCLLPKLTVGGSPGRRAMADHWQAIVKFNSAHRVSSVGPMTINAVEIAVADAARIELIAESLAVAGLAAIEVFVELPVDQDCRDSLKTLAKYEGLRLRAKIRTGGVSPELFPSCEEVARFILQSAEVDVPFKATAGLHHPLRGEHPISYEFDCSTVVMHGFLNLAMAAAIAQNGELNQVQLTTLLGEGVVDEIYFDDHFATWRGITVSTAHLTHTRQHGFRSFGSCSFIEPVEDLQQLGYLPLDE